MARRYLASLIALFLVPAIGKVTSEPPTASPKPRSAEEASAPASIDFVPASFTDTDGDQDDNFLDGEETAFAGQEGADSPFADEEPGLASRPKAAPLTPLSPDQVVANGPVVAYSPGSPPTVVPQSQSENPGMIVPHKPDESGPESPEPKAGPRPRQPGGTGPESPEPDGTEQTNEDYESDGYASTDVPTAKPTSPPAEIEPESELKKSSAERIDVDLLQQITTSVLVPTTVVFFFL